MFYFFVGVAMGIVKIGSWFPFQNRRSVCCIMMAATGGTHTENNILGCDDHSKAKTCEI